MLDTNVAQLSVVGRYQGMAKGAPWADQNGLLTEAHFSAKDAESGLVGQIARFVIGNGIKRVLPPTHLLHDATSSCFPLDIAACVALRTQLDHEGGHDIAIDYPLLVSNMALNDAAQRRVFVSELASVPVDSVWLRISGFGSDGEAISKVPEPRRAQDFVGNTLPSVDRLARQVTKLRIPDDGVAGLLNKNAERIDLLRAVLENLQETEANSTRSASVRPPVSVKMVRKRDRY